MMCLQRVADLVGGKRARRLSLHRIVDGCYLLAQPALDRGVALLQGAQASADYLADRGIAPAGDELVHVAGLVGGQADGAFLDGRHDAGFRVWYEFIIPKRPIRASRRISQALSPVLEV